MIRHLGLTLSLIVCTTISHAEELNVDYASFYGHVKKIDKPDTDKLRFAFGFTHIAYNRLCKLEKAEIVTQKQTLPLIVENGTRFTVPSDKVLKMAKAKVSIELDDNANQCDMSVQLETKAEQLKHSYTHAELKALLNQYQAFFSNMGSFMSFMMPSAEGLVLKLQNEQVLNTELSKLLDERGNINLDQDWFEKGLGLSLPSKPIRITALVIK